jgi:hypothetical protein
VIRISIRVKQRWNDAGNTKWLWVEPSATIKSIKELAASKWDLEVEHPATGLRLRFGDDVLKDEDTLGSLYVLSGNILTMDVKGEVRSLDFAISQFDIK